MAAFDYEALDPGGRSRKGTITADSPRLARRELRRRNLVPVAIRPADGRTARTTDTKARPPRLPWLLDPAIGPRELSMITRQLATLIGAAAPVEEALQAVAMQAESPAAKRILLSVRAGVTEGQSLSRALAGHERSFSPLYRAMVAAGETSGTLAPVFERLADHLEKSEKVRAKALAALIYPCVLAVTAVGIVIALMSFVVPKVVEQFDSLGRELPALTQGLIAVSAFSRDWGLVVLALLGLGIVLFLRLNRRPAVRRRTDALLLRLPVVGKLLRSLHTARLARTLGALIASGSPVVEALAAAKATLRNAVLQQALADVAVQVREGASLSQALKRGAMFPPVLTYMAAMGERSGSLGPLLEKCADYLEAEFDGVVTVSLGLLEPAIIVVMGAVVAGIVLAIMLPLLQFNAIGL